MENTDVWIKLIDSLPSILTAVGAIITAIGVILIGYFTYQANKQIGKQSVTLAEVHDGVNGQSQKLEEFNRQLGFDKGVESEQNLQAAKDESFVAGKAEGDNSDVQ